MKDPEQKPEEVTFHFGGSNMLLFSVSRTSDMAETADVSGKVAHT
jgi:hypothetical protein